VVLLVHGFPGCAEHARLMSDAPLVRHVRIIAPDRPGYGQSELQSRITPLQFAAQMRDLLDAKKIDKVSIISVSGGSPYAMALAWAHPERVIKISSLAGVAPLTRKNYIYMNRQQKKAWLLRNLVPEPILHWGLNRIWNQGLEKVEEALFTNMTQFSVHDQKVFAHPEIGPILIETTRNALTGGPGGVLRDLKVYSRSWGFPLHEIQCPVTIWHGLEDDIVHPKYAEELQSHLKKSQLRQVPAESHYSLPMNMRDEILKDLLSQ
jgi:pimeloyl-ACP methyl ester carboxylesterase